MIQMDAEPARGERDPSGEPDRRAMPTRRDRARTLILVVEDHEDTRYILAGMVRMLGYEVVTAEDGHEALTALGERRPDLVLLDLMMPRMDGWQFRRAQRALSDQELAAIPVVLLTAVHQPEREARQLNAAAWLIKPVDLNELSATIQRVLASSGTPPDHRSS